MCVARDPMRPIGVRNRNGWQVAWAEGNSRATIIMNL